MRVMALVIRDFRRLWQSRGLLIMTVVQPAAYLLIFAVMFTRQFGDVNYQGEAIPYLMFLLPGLLALQSYQAFHTQLSLSSGDRRWGILLMISIAGTRSGEYVLGQAVARILLGAAQGVIIVLVGVFLMGAWPSFPVALWRIAVAGGAWLASTAFWAALGISIGIRLLNEQKRDVLWALFNLPVMFTSSVFYNVDQAPPVIRVLGHLNPLTHGADVLRACMFGVQRQVTWRFGTIAALAAAAIAGSLLLVQRTPLSRRSTR